MLKTFSSSIFISSIIISLIIGLSYTFIDEDLELMRTGQNVPLGVALLILSILTMPFSLIKARDLAFRSRNGISRAETFLIATLYFAALFTTLFIVFIGCCLLEGDSNLSMFLMFLFFGVGGAAVVFFLAEAWTLFLTIPKKQPAKIWTHISNYIVPHYSGLAIAVFWEGAFDQGWETDIVDTRKLLLSIVMAFVLILPFQRLFWYESFIESQSRKENLSALASIFLSVAVAVAGVL